MTAAERQAKWEAAAAAAREARRQAFLALRPARLSAPLETEWAAQAAALADDPPSWSPSQRYAALLHEYVVETVNMRLLREQQLPTPAHQVVRETTPAGAVRVKVSPFVPLLEASLKRLRELADMLEFSPRGARKARGSQFDAA